MTIEVRQLIVRCQVLLPAPPAPRAVPPADLHALKEHLLGQCKAWLRDELQRLKER